MTIFHFMEFLKSEGFTAEEIFSILCEISKEGIEAAKFSEINKFVNRLKKERVHRRKLNPYEQGGE